MGVGVGVTAPSAISTRSRKTGYDKELRMKAVLGSIYTNIKGDYNIETKRMPNAIYVTVSEELSDASEGRITLKLPLSEPGVFGNAMAISNEEQVVTRAATVYRNNCRKVITTPGYGVRKLDAEYLKLFDKHIDDLATWNAEEEDLEIHQAHLETFGETLIYGDTQANCVRHWNGNMYIAGLDLRSAFATYSADNATYTANIVAKLLEAGNGSLAPTNNQVLNQPNLSNIQNAAIARRIAMLRIPGLPGGKGWILAFSERQATYLGDPAWCTRNLGSLYVSRGALSEKVQNWEGVLGAYKNLLLVQDVRAATLLPAGSSEPYSLTAGYMWHGNCDLRNRDEADVRDVVALLGQGALLNWYPEKLHTIEQTDDYGAIKGVGTQLVRGIQTPRYFNDAGTGQPEQFSSMAVLCGMPDYV